MSTGGPGLVVVGAVLILLGRLPGSDKLPGDLVCRGGRWTVYVPGGTMILVSLLLTLLLNLILRR